MPGFKNKKWIDEAESESEMDTWIVLSPIKYIHA